MDKTVTGPVYVLGDDIDTDQIIPAQHLVYNPSNDDERKFFGKFALSGVPAEGGGLPGGKVPFIDPYRDEFHTDFRIILAGKNFGCGSSREHAPLALAEAGIKIVIAEFYARIFFRNSVNGGYLIPYETPQRLIDIISTGETLTVDIENNTLTLHDQDNAVLPLSPLGDILPILEAGDVFEYAKRAGMMAR